MYIKKLNFKINSKFLSVNKLNDECGLVKSLEMTQSDLNNIFKKFKFVIVVILGDSLEAIILSFSI